MEIMTKVIADPANVKTHKQNLLVHSLRALAGVLVLFYLMIALLIIVLRWVDPPTSAVQIERRVEAWSNHTPYQKRYRLVPLQLISPQVQHAVVVAEDAPFYEHYGFDWTEVEIQVDETLAGRQSHGASTSRSNWSRICS